MILCSICHTSRPEHCGYATALINPHPKKPIEESVQVQWIRFHQIEAEDDAPSPGGAPPWSCVSLHLHSLLSAGRLGLTSLSIRLLWGSANRIGLIGFRGAKLVLPCESCSGMGNAAGIQIRCTGKEAKPNGSEDADIQYPLSVYYRMYPMA
ncbi:hypothetical protein VZT92_008359 [Zoarces viviparus]|uniref:Uncharacterized protein n=1 Tax=Zoarces viviparus TaxID=48416 RepID=A0AAW1FEY5_ZOAVI